MINKKNKTGDWEHQDKSFSRIDGYIQDQNSSRFLVLEDGGRELGTRVILASKPNTMWVNETVYNQWFYLTPKDMEMPLTAKSNDLTTISGSNLNNYFDFHVCLFIRPCVCPSVCVSEKSSIPCSRIPKSN